jgi:hypothetical protein
VRDYSESALTGIYGSHFVVGGAMMAWAYDANRVTRDVESTFVSHGVVSREARNVTQVMSLPPWWLNEQVGAYVRAERRRKTRGI